MPTPEAAPKTPEPPAPAPPVDKPAPLAVHEAPEAEVDQEHTDAKPPVEQSEPKPADHPAPKPPAPKKPHNTQPSAAGIVVTTIFIMLLLAGLTILVYIKSK